MQSSLAKKTRMLLYCWKRKLRTSSSFLFFSFLFFSFLFQLPPSRSAKYVTRVVNDDGAKDGDDCGCHGSGGEDIWCSAVMDVRCSHNCDHVAFVFGERDGDGDSLRPSFCRWWFGDVAACGAFHFCHRTIRQLHSNHRSIFPRQLAAHPHFQHIRLLRTWP